MPEDFTQISQIATNIPNRLPPQNIEAEQAVLGSLMLDKGAIIKIADILYQGDFYRGIHNDIYTEMLFLYQKGEPIDILSLTNRLEEIGRLETIGGTTYLTQLVNTVPTASHIIYYAKIVHKKKILRDLIEASYGIAQLAYQETEEAETMLDLAEQRILSISQKSLSQEFMPVKSGLEEAFERLDKLHRGGGSTMRGVPTNFTDLDNYLAGLQKSDLILLAARPSLGKTSLALDICRNVATKQKVPVGIFSLEMSKQDLVDRFLAAQAGIDLWRLRTGKLHSEGPDNDFLKIQDAISTLSEAPIFIDDAASPTILQMRTMARRLQVEHGLGLLVIDYLQLIQPRNHRDSVVQQVTEISRSLKSLARELEVPVLALSQLSRATEGRDGQVPRLSDLRESGCLAADSLIMNAETGELLKIKDLAQRPIQKSIPVFSIDENWQLVIRPMTKVFSSGRKKLYELTTRSGRKIRASSNHPFKKINGWHRLDSLKAGDRIALPRQLESLSPTSPLTAQEIILLAHLLGDGCVLPKQPYHYTSADLKNIDFVRNAAKELFDINGRLIKQKNWFHLYLPAPYRLARGKKHPITKWFELMGIKRVRSWQKTIPGALFQCNTMEIALFLRHLWATDGNISWKYLSGRQPAANIYYSTTSLKLAQQVQHLLLRVGLQSTLGNAKKDGYRICYHLRIQGSTNQLNFLLSVGCAGQKGKIIPELIYALKQISPNPNLDIIPKEAWKTIVEPIKIAAGATWRQICAGLNTAYCGSTLFKTGIGRSRFNQLATFLNSEHLKDLATSNIYWDEIISINPLGVEEVYDATVADTHNFVANDIVVHNSLEQDADVVLFIYREDKVKGKENSERTNIADIIIAKHRNGPLARIELYFNESNASFKNLEKHFSDFSS